MVQPDGDADSRAMEERKGKELEHADSSEVEQQATVPLQLQAYPPREAAGGGIPTELTFKFSTEALCKRAHDGSSGSY